MADKEPDRYVLGLLVDLRELCQDIGQQHHRFASRLHALLREVASPNVHGLEKELTHRVLEVANDGSTYPETMRTISLNGNISIARAAFAAATQQYPDRSWRLFWGAYLVEKYDPHTDG